MAHLRMDIARHGGGGVRCCGTEGKANGGWWDARGCRQRESRAEPSRASALRLARLSSALRKDRPSQAI